MKLDCMGGPADGICVDMDIDVNVPSRIMMPGTHTLYKTARFKKGAFLVPVDMNPSEVYLQYIKYKENK